LIYKWKCNLSQLHHALIFSNTQRSINHTQITLEKKHQRMQVKNNAIKEK